MNNLILIGMMGCGKSTVGRLAAEKLGLAFVDTDERIEAEAGRTIPAHLPMDYFFRYLLIREIHQVKTLTEMQQLTLKQFAGGKL